MHWFRLREEMLTDEHEVPDLDEDGDSDDEIDEEDIVRILGIVFSSLATYRSLGS